MKLTVRQLEWGDLTPNMLLAWAELEARVLEPNAYLSPYFVAPAQRYLPGHADTILIWIERGESAGRELVGVGIFDPVQSTQRFPLAHLRAFCSRHSYLSGLLVDATAAEEVIEAWLAHCSGKTFPWHGVDFKYWPADGKSDHLVRGLAAQRGATWHEYDRLSRSVLYPQQAGESYIESHVGSGRRKDLRRCMRRLTEIGPVTWTLQRGETFDEASVDRFLELEQAGWKGEQRDALASDGRDEQFFREMVRGFAGAGRALFCELRVGERVVSSTSNFISGRAGFAFKIGWHPDFAKMSPGILTEVELIRQAPSLLGQLDFVDSGAAQGSYLEELWGGRRPVSKAILATSSMGRATLGAIDIGRQLKRRLFGGTPSTKPVGAV